MHHLLFPNPNISRGVALFGPWLRCTIQVDVFQLIVVGGSILYIVINKLIRSTGCSGFCRDDSIIYFYIFTVF